MIRLRLFAEFRQLKEYPEALQNVDVCEFIMDKYHSEKHIPIDIVRLFKNFDSFFQPSFRLKLHFSIVEITFPRSTISMVASCSSKIHVLMNSHLNMRVVLDAAIRKLPIQFIPELPVNLFNLVNCHPSYLKR